MPGARLYAVSALSAIARSEARPKQAIAVFDPLVDSRDRSFLMEIVYGVLRHRDTLDWILSRFLRHPGKLTPMTANNLRTAVYQLCYMRVPQWAVVNEAVEIEKSGFEDGTRGMPPLVNAVLRNVIRSQDLFAFPLKFDDPVMGLAVNTSHPRWMIKRWIKRFGPEEAGRIAAANMMKPPLTLRANTLRTTRERLLGLLADHGISAEPALYSPEGILVKGTVHYSDLLFAAGLFVVQDEASQLVSHLLGPLPGERILDACAAPGGKTTHIAQLMNDSGEVLAVDKDPERLRRLNQNISSLGITSVRVIQADVSGLAGLAPFDRILLDAPCSATGVIRRNPDVKYRHKAADLQAFREKQLELLRTVAGLLKKGGTLVYSVCSIEPEEGEQVINDFLKVEGDFRIIDTGGLSHAQFFDRGLFRTFPHRDAMDGFFGATLCRQN
ncbi:MAG: 16S rRNA (cytosine(967)-C(5))-methyltransferase RsmB [Thermodesulfovibrionales bacterium]